MSHEKRSSNSALHRVDLVDGAVEDVEGTRNKTRSAANSHGIFSCFIYIYAQ